MIPGLAEGIALLDALEPEARAQLELDLEWLADETLAIQQSLSPFRTGNLYRNLTKDLALEQLRIAVGYPQLKGGRSPLFYAIVAEFGRRAGQKLVTVRRRGARNKKKPGATFTRLQRWTALAGRHFVHVEDRIATLADNLLDHFWDDVLARAGASK
jgi:hypothetical protein